MCFIFLALLALVSFSPRQLEAQQLTYTEITGSATITLGADSTLKLGTRIVVTGFDSVRDTVNYLYYKNDTLVMSKRRQAFSDSTFVPAPTYNTGAKYNGCAIVERGGRNSGVEYPPKKICWVWNYFRDAPLGSIDSLFRITLRPLGPKLVADSASSCSNWQKNNPNKSVWVIVNVKAVPRCMHYDSLGIVRLSVWQFCAFGEYKDGRKVILENSQNNPYCTDEYNKWISEVQS